MKNMVSSDFFVVPTVFFRTLRDRDGSYGEKFHEAANSHSAMPQEPTSVARTLTDAWCIAARSHWRALMVHCFQNRATYQAFGWSC